MVLLAVTWAIQQHSSSTTALIKCFLEGKEDTFTGLILSYTVVFAELGAALLPDV